MKEVDLRDCFDDCYPSFEDFSAEIKLHYDPERRCWANEQIEFWKEFWKDDTMGWRFRQSDGHNNYGYDSLRNAVAHYMEGRISKECAAGKGFCASKVLDIDYQQCAGSDELFCKVTERYFLPKYNEERFSQKCNALTNGLNMTMGGTA